MSPVEILTVVGQTNGSEHMLVSSILTGFALTVSSGQNSYPLHLRLNFSLPGRPNELYQHDQDIFLRNCQWLHRLPGDLSL